MKLWQKIFLGTLALMVLCTSLLTLLFVRESWQTVWDEQLDRALTQQQYLARLIKTGVVSTRLQNGLMMLDADAADAAAVRSASSQLTDEFLLQLGLYRDGQALDRPVDGCTDAMAGAQDAAEIPGTLYEFSRGEEGAVLVCSLPFTAEQQAYRLVCRFSVQAGVDRLAGQSLRLVAVSLTVSLAGAGLLVVVVRTMLRPLHTLSRTARRIAGGDYAQRLELTSGDELAGLAQDMNRLARAVQQRVDQLENTAESQKTFTANMAHEMKTPLTSILGFADLLQLQKQVPDEQRMRYAGIIVEETRRLRSLSGKLMELLAVENRNLVLTPVDMPGLFKEVATAIQPLLAGGRLRLEEYCQPMVVNGDRELLKSLLYNFLDNARKASPAGSRLVLAGRPQNGWAEICIRDYGRGIPAAELDKIRQPFYMVDKSRARKAGGAGLGLALCEQIVRIHGGRYEVDSRVGQGTLITLYLPLAGREERKETDHEA